MDVTDRATITALNEAGGVVSVAARILGITRQSMQDRVRKARSAGASVPDNPNSRFTPVAARKVFSIPDLPSDQLPIDELIARRKSEFARRKEFKDARKLIPVDVSSNEPIGLLIFGDPHLDDPGTDIGAVERDINLIKETDGLYGAGIGDLQNNWIGRLARLYANQETTADQSWQLVEWFITEVGEDWLFLVDGNHDHWSGNGDPLRWISRRAGGVKDANEVRIELRFPNESNVRIAARHDWPGSSIWNPTHAQLRAAMLVVHDDVVISGHKHTGGYQLIRIPSSQKLAHCTQLGSYKIFDTYADERAFPNRHISPSVTILIDPEATTDLGRVRLEHDAEAAADYLTWMRSR